MTMKQLVQKLNEASKIYYSESDNIMSDKEYDALYNQLVLMEEETGIVLPDSPTLRVGYEVVSELKKVTHEVPALSLDKSKDVEVIKKWMNGKICNISYKLDGLTAVAVYNYGRLVSLVSRGNGLVGEDVTHNAKYIKGLPMTIPYLKKTIIRGEVVISYQNFNSINEELEKEGKTPYANPRNLASGSLRLFDSKEAKKRHMEFKAFTLVNPYIEKSEEQFETVGGCFSWMKYMGFDLVDNTLTYHKNLNETIQNFTEKAKNYPYPVDGLVLTFEKIDRSIGSTGKYPKYAMAFKWSDETKETTFKRIVWSASKTGLINPVAEFEPVELEGTMVRRASVHNLTMINLLGMLPGDTITVYKANMIIPQIDKNLSAQERGFVDISTQIPKKCPVCGQHTVIKTGKNGSSFLYCINEDCPAKHLGKFERMVHRDALNIVGLSGPTLEKFLSYGFLHQMSDLYHLEQYKTEIIDIEGFGEKSFNKMISAINQSRNTTFRKMFYAIGIPGAGKDVAKILDDYFSSNKEYLGTLKSKNLPLFIMEDLYSRLPELDGIGEILADSMVNWFGKKKNFNEYLSLLHELNIEDDEVVMTNNKKPFVGKTFVITGSLSHYENRNALKAEIESLGGKVSNSVSKKTSYLINNDINSASSKNKKAKELGIPIITETDYKNIIATWV